MTKKDLETMIEKLKTMDRIRSEVRRTLHLADKEIKQIKSALFEAVEKG